MAMRTKVVFLDRDGVINKARHHPSGDARNYVTKWEEFEWIEGSKEAIIRLLDNGYIVVVVTNQACIGKGIVPFWEICSIHNRVREEIRVATQHLPAKTHGLLKGYLSGNLAFFVCPHTKEDHCSCRKPMPGMLYAAAHARSIHLPSAWMVGDGAADITAGYVAGLEKVILIEPDKQPKPDPMAVIELGSDYGYPNLHHAVDYILARDEAEATKEKQ